MRLFLIDLAKILKYSYDVELTHGGYENIFFLFKYMKFLKIYGKPVPVYDSSDRIAFDLCLNIEETTLDPSHIRFVFILAQKRPFLEFCSCSEILQLKFVKKFTNTHIAQPSRQGGKDGKRTFVNVSTFLWKSFIVIFF